MKGSCGEVGEKARHSGEGKVLSSKSIATGEKSGYVDRGGCFVGAKWF